MSIRFKDITVATTSFAADDYLAVDGATNGTRKFLASTYLNQAVLTTSNVTFGTLLVTGTSQFNGNVSLIATTDYSPQIILTNIENTAGSGPYYIFQKARASTTAIQNGDNLGSILWQGYANGGYQTGILMNAAVASAVSGSAFDAVLNFTVNTTSGQVYPAQLTKTGWNSTAIGQTTAAAGTFTKTQVGPNAPVTVGALLSAVILGNGIEFGHSNSSGYRSTLGSINAGNSFLAFSAEAGTNVNTYKTRGIKGSIIQSDVLGGFIFGSVTTASADNQSLTTLASLTTAGLLTIPGSSNLTGNVGIGYSGNIAGAGLYITSALTGGSNGILVSNTSSFTSNGLAVSGLNLSPGTIAKGTATGGTFFNLYIGGGGTVTGTGTANSIQVFIGGATNLGGTNYGIYQGGTDPNYFSGSITSNTSIGAPLIVASGLGNQFGSASGSSSSPTTSNTNILLYNNSSTNWAGIGSDASGNIYFATGTSGVSTRVQINVFGQLLIGNTSTGTNCGLALTNTVTSQSAQSRGISVSGVHTATANSDNMYAYFSNPTFGTVTFTGLTGIGVYLYTPTTTGSGTLANVYMLYIAQNVATGGGVTVTNAYGVYQAGTDPNLFSGNVNVGSVIGNSVWRLYTRGVTSDSTSQTFVCQNSSGYLFYVRSDGLFGIPQIGSFTSASAANLYTDGTFMYKSTSSKRYKSNIVDYARGIDDLMRLRPVSFNSISKHDDNRKTFAGFIAEEVDELGMKEYVTYDSDGRPDGLNYAQMTAILTKAVQDLKRQNDELAKRLVAA